jgi:hypothetical protein
VGLVCLTVVSFTLLCHAERGGGGGAVDGSHFGYLVG